MKISKDRWEGLSPKEKWDVIVALRGPDCPHSDSIKWFTTSVIRHTVSKVMRVGGLINYAGPKFVVVPVGPLQLIKSKKKTAKEAAAAGESLQSYSYSSFTVEPTPPFAYWDYSHFFGHVMEAAMVLGLSVIQLPADEWLKAVVNGRYHLFDAFYQAVSKHYGDKHDFTLLMKDFANHANKEEEDPSNVE